MAVKLDKKALQKTVEEVRVALKTHGGDIELVSVGVSSVKVRLTGACQHCPMAAATFQGAVERTLLERVKGLKKVKLVD